MYSAFVTGEFLDKNVSTQRTGFTLLDEDDDPTLDLITIKKIQDAAVNVIKDHLSEYIEPIQENKVKRIKEYIDNNSPQYKFILKYKSDKLHRIPPKINNEELEIELFKLSQEVSVELKQQSDRFLNKECANLLDLEEYKREYTEFIEKENDLGKANLAQYIIHRKVILNLLSNGLQVGEDSKYQLEDYVHNLVFPMRRTSDDIGYDKHNLWIIDEKLSYHYYLASDIKLKNMGVINVGSDDRPDIIVMNNPVMITNQEDSPLNSVVIIEFKRPMRNKYNEDDDNPINQVYKYVRKIRSGQELDKNGRPVCVHDQTQFYPYVIADLTPKLIEDAQLSGLLKTPDGLGYFGYNPVKEINAYIEIISYQKMVQDANKRNKILFDKLFSPSTT